MCQAARQILVAPAKYGGHNGMYHNDHPALLGIAPALQPQLVAVLNTSLANSTWKGIKNIKLSIERMESKYALNLPLPWGRSEVVNYILALSMEKLAPSTIRVYVSRVASLHKNMGMCPGWQGDDIRMLMRGVANLPKNSDPAKQRLAVTPAVLRVLHSRLSSSPAPDLTKKMVWAACCLLYVGSLRSCELLSPSRYSFDPTSTLRRCDVELAKDLVNGRRIKYLRLSVKNPKEFRQAGTVTVEILPCPGMFFCPVTALTDFMRYTPGYPRSMPLFRSEEALLSRDWLNKILKEHLDPVLTYGVVRTHGFRAGLTSALAKCGVSDDTLQSLGRWHSQAYRSYIKMGRNLRLSTQQELVSKISEMAETNWGVETTLLVQ